MNCKRLLNSSSKNCVSIHVKRECHVGRLYFSLTPLKRQILSLSLSPLLFQYLNLLPSKRKSIFSEKREDKAGKKRGAQGGSCQVRVFICFFLNTPSLHLLPKFPLHIFYLFSLSMEPSLVAL